VRAAIFAGPRSIEVGDRPDPLIAAPTDAVVRVVLTCVCGSDLWYYRGQSPHAPGPIGHEFVGVVDQVGAEVHGIVEGGLVVAPFKYSDGTCANCRVGWTSSCVQEGAFGADGFDGGGVDAVLGCVGTGESMATAFAVARPGSTVGFVGVPQGVEVPIDTMFARNIGLRGGSAPARTYIPELLEDVLMGRIHPGRVFDFETDLEHIAEAYAAMDERRAIKSLVRVGARGSAGGPVLNT
jgi:threonine dehydrogenase-like Zn-dependent dehydrogenase